ncbi:MAG: hypothetical protein M3443_06750 [Actinomycetota bacterium]|nr:hypothetical protein [Actinomycetota bacterium]
MTQHLSPHMRSATAGLNLNDSAKWKLEMARSTAQQTGQTVVVTRATPDPNAN